MMEVWKRYWQEIQKIYASLDHRKRLYILFGAISTVILLVILVSIATHTEYEVLFSGLDPNEAGVIVEKLKEQNVSYQLRGGGSSILVPSSRVYDLRLEMAVQGLPQAGSVGYEIFDKNNIGTTDFIQKINYRRALEGELARTISILNEVKSARVHLVIPEPSLFVEDQKKTTASITLKLIPGRTLSIQQIHGIQNLVAASVEGLNTENVTIVDSFGNVLAEPTDSNSIYSLSAGQMELKRNVENYYAEKLKKLLEKVVGKDRVAVQVSVELNFDRVDRTVTTFDPDNVIVISEQKNTQANAGTNGEGQGKSEDITTNYEVSRTVERIIQDVGNIKRITAAVMVDGKYEIPAKAGKDAPSQYVPLTAAQLAQISEIVKSAIGYSSERGDIVKVANMPFDYSHQERERAELAEYEKKRFWETLIKKGIYGLLFFAVAFLLWKVIRSFKTLILPYIPHRYGELEAARSEMEMDLLQENKEHIRLQQTLANLSKKNPGDAAKLVKVWLVEDVNAG